MKSQEKKKKKLFRIKKEKILNGLKKKKELTRRKKKELGNFTGVYKKELGKFLGRADFIQIHFYIKFIFISDSFLMNKKRIRISPL